MAKNGEEMKDERPISEETLRELIELQRVGNAAVRKAQQENRRRNVPSWYSIGGVIFSDQDISLNKPASESDESSRS